ncbi:NlpC/P60 family protein [Arcicella aquatica]|uniref:NlpC/P60 family protein n=1 Tax=Arcicella aquatica TaxID=217141 RepID=A0ABU5QIR5_9BACT|nr:NlpC/P60 family protein [Arcicella aquatica]MEA5256386.1 NlpC/P60 family protein [Arcicella aquatica]
MNPIDISKIEKSSKISAIVSFMGIVIFMGSLIYAGLSLNSVENELTLKQKKIDSLNIYYSSLSKNINSLKDDEKELTDFLVRLIESTSKANKSSDLYNGINWNSVTKSITNLPSGKRKTSVFIALLMTWKEIPFMLNKKNPSIGFDSPRFIKYVLEQVGVNVEKKKDERLSDAMMRSFQKVEKPLPGDLIFYKGKVGSFCLIYLGDGLENGQGIAIGTLQAISPLSIYETKNINTPFFPFIGYYRPNY